jgi:hypothetical protein
VLLFFSLIYAIVGVQLWSGSLKTRCVNIASGVFNNNLFCGAIACPNQVMIGNNLDVNKSIYFCGKTDENPYYGFISFDNIF